VQRSSLKREALVLKGIPMIAVPNGIRLVKVPPLDESFISLEKGVTVLYGKNGAGKSRALEAVASAFRGHAREGFISLYFTYPVDSWLRGEDSVLNPWEVIRKYCRRAGVASSRLATWVKTREIEPPVRDLVTLLADSHQIREEEELDALIEVARQGRFIIDVNEKSRRLVVGGLPDDDTPALRFVQTEAVITLTHRPSLDEYDVDPPDLQFQPNEFLFWNMCDGMRSALREAQGKMPGPLWCSDEFFRATDDEFTDWKPALLVEEAVDLGQETLIALQALYKEHLRSQNPHLVEEMEASKEAAFANTFKGGNLFGDEWESYLAEKEVLFQRFQSLRDQLDRKCGDIIEDVGDDAFRVAPFTREAASILSTEANTLFTTLLLDAPVLSLQVRSPHRWPAEGALSWDAADPSGVIVPIERLSTAQRRWAILAIRLAASHAVGRAHSVVLLDEPELALHRRAERHLADGLVQVADRLGAIVIVATHSPALLRNPTTVLLRVHRSDTGKGTIDELSRDFKGRVHDLGLDVADLLQFCQLILLVEGLHDEIVFSELFRESFARNGILIIPARGVRGIAQVADAQLLFDFTDARLVAVADNANASELQTIWHAARDMAARGEDFMAELRKMRSLGQEGRFLEEFCSKALKAGRGDRVAEVTGLPKRDIVEYLPCNALVPGHESWEALRERHARSAAGLKFKEEFLLRLGAEISGDSVRAAVGQLDNIHSDLSAVEQLCLAALVPPS
jgi:energy-coupling factor transporter ATP-binding protein EcfA2